MISIAKNVNSIRLGVDLVGVLFIWLPNTRYLQLNLSGMPTGDFYESLPKGIVFLFKSVRII